jgi:hypothetical protein
MNQFTILACSLMLSAPTIAFAQDTEPTEASGEADEDASEDEESPAPNLENSINVSAFGLANNNYTFNYEYLQDGTHGFIIEPSLSFNSDASSSYVSYGANLGYRWHWSGKQNSGFLGLTLGYGIGTGKGTITVPMGKASSEDKTFDLALTSLIAVPNIGYRWTWNAGLNVTFRIGVGYGQYDVSTSSLDPDAQLAVALVNGLLTVLPIALDGELSLGWCF